MSIPGISATAAFTDDTFCARASKKIPKFCAHNIEYFVPLVNGLVSPCSKFMVNPSIFLTTVPETPTILYAWATNIKFRNEERRLLAFAYEEAGQYMYIEDVTSDFSPYFQEECIVICWDPSEVGILKKHFSNAHYKVLKTLMDPGQKYKNKSELIEEAGWRYHFEMLNSSWSNLTAAHGGLVYQNIYWVKMLAKMYSGELFEQQSIKAIEKPAINSDIMSAFNADFQSVTGYNPKIEKKITMDGFEASLVYNNITYRSMGRSKQDSAFNLVKNYAGSILNAIRQDKNK